jgi:sulfotransferase family protein
MKYNIVVATHHKTGTVWMDGVFKTIAREVGVPYVDFRSQYGRLDEALRGPFILLNYDSNFREHADLLDREDVRVLHLVRDPRDVLISAMHYHKKSRESWLHEPIPGYDNVTYQRSLRMLPSKFDQYVFEMEHSTASTLRDVLSWRYGRENCFETRYEDLRQDEQLDHWRRISEFLGFDEREREISCRCFWQNSLFGGLSRLGNNHVRSGDIAQWKREFTRQLGHAFLKRFPDALQFLGYETSNDWVMKLKPANTNSVLTDFRRVAALQLALVVYLARYM